MKKEVPLVKNDPEEIKKELKKYFEKRKEIAFAFLFGSVVKNQTHKESDIDIGVYFYPNKKEIEVEEDVKYKYEDKIWADIEKILRREVDLVVMNRAPATICLNILRGIPVLIKDWKVYLKFMEIATDIGIEFREMVISDFKKGIK